MFSEFHLVNGVRGTGRVDRHLQPNHWAKQRINHIKKIINVVHCVCTFSTYSKKQLGVIGNDKLRRLRALPAPAVSYSILTSCLRLQHLAALLLRSCLIGNATRKHTHTHSPPTFSLAFLSHFLCHFLWEAERRDPWTVERFQTKTVSALESC